jgi:hypothetical protein
MMSTYREENQNERAISDNREKNNILPAILRRTKSKSILILVDVVVTIKISLIPL